jgi:uncharacterized tellurite resistance protein B-like protein
MIARIRQFFEKHMQPTDAADDLEHRLKLASAALLIEMMHADLEITAAEESRLRDVLQAHFRLEPTETETVLELAHEEKHAAADYYQFTSLINQHYTQQQKIQLVEDLWKIAWADAHIDSFEEHLVRKLADLLHVPHKHYIQAKHRVIDKPG